VPQTRPGDIRLASIHIYPMKAARAVNLDESRVEPWGLAGDRRWEAVKAQAAWRAGRFELPDYYLVLAREDTEGPDFYLGPLRSARVNRVVLVPEQEPAQQAAGVLHALGSLRHGPWWPGLDEVIEVARTFYPDSLGQGNVTGPGPETPEAGRVRAG
jgi:MOSC N-terminal beta barrel domain